jgi:hypothetical protein
MNSDKEAQMVPNHKELDRALYKPRTSVASMVGLLSLEERQD